MCRVAVVFYVLSCRCIGQSVLVAGADLGHDGAQCLILHFQRRIRVRMCGLQVLNHIGRKDALECMEWLVVCSLADEVGVSLQRDDRMRQPAQDALDRRRRIEACGDGAAEGFDAGDCRSRGAGDDDVNCGVQLIGVLSDE